MDTNKKYVIGIVVGALVLIGIFVLINSKLNEGQSNGVDLSSFAMCIKDKGTIFYGAFWCPHCAATKKMFGTAAKDLPYHECSTADGNGQLADCTAAGVKGYPTWVFADGTRLSGETTLSTLASRTGCSLPAGVDGGPIVPSQSGGASSSIGTSTATTTGT